MSGETPETGAPPERRTLRWLLAGQVVLAVLLVGVDLLPRLTGLFAAPSEAPELTRPTRPGDQTRRFRPGDTGPGFRPDMPRRLLAVEGPDGTLSLRGGIAPGDGARVAAEVSRLRPSVVTLDSPGGSVSDALELGQALRMVGADTRVEDGAICLSACPYVFAGGVTRTVAEGARLGVHQHSPGENTILPAFLAVDDIQRGQAAVLAHLEAMGIDLRIMGPAMATPANEIYILTADELVEWGIVTNG